VKRGSLKKSRLSAGRWDQTMLWVSPPEALVHVVRRMTRMDREECSNSVREIEMSSQKFFDLGCAVVAVLDCGRLLAVHLGPVRGRENRNRPL
jgi:hypothetical protein